MSVILDAAATEFAETGYTSATTTAIASRAQVPIGSLYQYFPDKEALLYGIAERHLADGSAVVVDALDRASDAPDLETAIGIVVEAAVDANAGDPRVHRLLYREAPRPPELQAQLDELEDASAAWVCQELERRGVCAGPAAALRARTLVIAIEALVHDLVLDPPDGTTRQQATAEVTSVAIAMARA